MKILRLLIVPFVFLMVVIFRLIAPWKQVRFGVIWSSRLGHLMGNTQCYLCECDVGLYKGTFDIWAHVGKPANRVIADKYNKQLHIWPYWLVNMFTVVNGFFRNSNQYIAHSMNVDRDIFSLWDKCGPHIEFTDEEEREGQKLLHDLGIPEGAKWVCLIIRDKSYLKTKFEKVDFSYHDYRDSDISTYIPAALELAERGYYVLRMGEIVEKPFNLEHPRVIDYAMSGKRSDFGDLYLGAKCAICLGNSCGFMVIPQIFDRLVAIVNYVPIDYISTWQRGLVIWKHHIKNGKKMSIKEISDSGMAGCLVGPDFEGVGITLVDNTAQEILDVATEIADIDEGKLPDDQKEFWDKFPRASVKNTPLHPLREGMIIRVGREFLKGY